MIIVEITERGRRKSARVIFDDDGLADLFETHAHARGAETWRLPPKIAREHVGQLRERAAKRSDWRAGSDATELAKRISSAKMTERLRDVVLSVRVPRAVQSELDRIGKLAGRTPEQIIRASILAFIKAARER